MNFLEKAVKGTLLVTGLLITLPIAGPVGTISAVGSGAAIAIGVLTAGIDELGN